MNKKTKTVTKQEADAYRYIGPALKPNTSIFCPRKYMAQVTAHYLHKLFGSESSVYYEKTYYGRWWNGTTYVIREERPKVTVESKQRLTYYNGLKTYPEDKKVTIYNFQDVFTLAPQRSLTTYLQKIKKGK